VNGRADFDKYIQDNLKRPDMATSGQRVVVVLNFIVDTNGKIDSLKVIRSPGKIFSDEAMRLIREGPVWKPAEQNGKAISDEVRIRIVFK
jgi:TonB family protein